MLEKVPTLSLKTLKAVLNEKHKVKYRKKNDWKKSQIQTLVKLRKEGKSFELQLNMLDISALTKWDSFGQYLMTC